MFIPSQLQHRNFHTRIALACYKTSVTCSLPSVKKNIVSNPAYIPMKTDYYIYDHELKTQSPAIC
jgi:hypothetical protein